MLLVGWELVVVANCCCWLLMLVAAVNCCCWSLLLIVAVGWLLLIAAVGWFLLIAAAGCWCWLLLLVDCCWLLLLSAAVDCCCWLIAVDCCCWSLLLIAAVGWLLLIAAVGSLLLSAAACCCCLKSLWIFPEYSWWFAAKTNLQAKKYLNIFGCWWKIYEYIRVVGEKSVNFSRILMGEKWKRGSPRGSRLESEWILWLCAGYLYSIIQGGRQLSESQ